MGTDRLTRNELTWLFTQEARSAAQRLRQGVGAGVEAESLQAPVIIDEGTGGLESTLNRLDEAVGMLASLHGSPSPKGRRGKIDLAALVWEVAPDARVQLEMGEGTSVFGDESELRRMLQMLIGQGGDPTSAKGTGEISIRREGNEVRVGVHLGPDQPATFETERAWLSRMAVRYGGRLDLDGLMQTLTLPADVDSRGLEIRELKKELAEAQAQGEAYARELAAVFARSDGAPSPVSAARSASRRPPTADGLAVLVAAMRGLGTGLRGILSAIGRDIAPLRDQDGEAGEIASSVGRHVTAASEIVADLARLGACPLGELPRSTDVAEMLREIIRQDAVRAARREVTVSLEAPEAAVEVVAAGALTTLLQALLDHAIAVSPVGSQVSIALADSPEGLRAQFNDGGPPLPAHAPALLLSREFEAIAGRQAGLGLIAAHAIAAHAHFVLDAGQGSTGGRLDLLIPKA